MTRPRQVQACRLCGFRGHNARTCPDREGAPVAVAVAAPPELPSAPTPPPPHPAPPPLVPGPRRPAIAAPAQPFDPIAAARWAKEHGSTLARAAVVHGLTVDAVAAAWQHLFPREKRRRVP